MPLNPEDVGAIANAMYDIKKEAQIPIEPFKEGRDYVGPGSPYDQCVCSSCGYETKKIAGQPCKNITCPKCNQPLTGKTKYAQIEETDVTIDIDTDDLISTLNSLVLGMHNVNADLIKTIVATIMEEDQENADTLIRSYPELFSNLSLFPYVVSNDRGKIFDIARSVFEKLEALAEGYKGAQDDIARAERPDIQERFRFGQVERKDYGEWILLGTPNDVPEGLWEVIGGWRLGEIMIAPAELGRRFGRNNYEGAEGRVSMTYVFQHAPTKKLIQIYLWKATNAYDSEYPPIEYYVEDETLQEFSINGTNKELAEKFKAWLEAGSPNTTPDISDRFKFGQEINKDWLPKVGDKIRYKKTGEILTVTKIVDDYDLWWEPKTKYNTTHCSNGPNAWRRYLEPVKKQIPDISDRFKFAKEYKFKLPKKVWKGIKTVKSMGITNMFNVKRVKRILRDFNYPEVADWITNHPNKYIRVITQGKNSFELS